MTSSGPYSVVLLRQTRGGVQVVASRAGDDEVSQARAFAEAADGSAFDELGDREALVLVVCPFQVHRLALLPRDADWLAEMVQRAGVRPGESG